MYTYTQVCIPGLHISLGIFDRLWGLLEEQLDLTLAKEREGMDGNTFERYCRALREVARLKEKLGIEKQHAEVLGSLSTYLMLYLPDPTNDPSVKQARSYGTLG